MATKEEKAQIDHNFSYHAPDAEKVKAYEAARGWFRETAHAILTHCPPSRERSLAITKLEESMMWANAAIARNPSMADDLD